jgi:hypothetical protein
MQGICDARFAPLRDAFAKNLEDEIGAALVVRIGGKVVADLCGGWADDARTRPWMPDTVVNVFSTGKACVALTVLSLGLELDAPAFQGSTLRQVLSHQAGHPAIRVDVPQRAIYDWDWIVQALESQEPWWPPGTAHGYHVNTFGFLCGAIVRRTTGRRLRTQFAELVGDEARVAFGAPRGADGEPRVEQRREYLGVGEDRIVVNRLVRGRGSREPHGGVVAQDVVNVQAALACNVPKRMLPPCGQQTFDLTPRIAAATLITHGLLVR